MGAKRIPFEKRFWSKVKKTENCWLWTGSRTRQGYGATTINLQPIKSHRASWILHKGKIPKGLFVLHHCDNPPCVRPSHLWLGTKKENTQDMLKKGRYKPTQGELHGMCKLTKKQVVDIRSLRKNGWKLREVAEQFGIGRVQVSRICTGERWGHVKEGLNA